MSREQFFKQPSVMSAQAHFAQVPGATIQRSKFNRSHAVKTTFDAGKLIPIFLDEVLPGDTFTQTTTVFARLATPLRPLMDNIYIDIHYFFVPNRLVFDQWAEFMGERPTPAFDPDSVELPKMPWNPGPGPAINSMSGSVGAYFGLPMTSSDSPDPDNTVSCIPFRAYKLIYNEWYRDQNLIAPAALETGAYNPLMDVNFAPYNRGKRHDYFTGCLPWPQKGDPVTIPLGDDAYVFGFPDSALSPFVAYGTNNEVELTGGAGTTGAVNYDASVAFPATTPGLRLSDSVVNPIGFADLAAVSSVSVNDLRTAFQIQTLLERDARGGTRYIELILSHFGVKSDDARLQRPEYLGGGTQRININPIASTATVPDEAPQGNLAGVGTGVIKGSYQKSFTEHGFIIGLASARADLTYQQGIERFWSRTTRYDYYWPSLAHLGEQAVLMKEIYYTNVPANDNLVFGYQERYAEYRYKPSIVTGLFNSKADGTLDTWHLAQDFGTMPGLTPGFIAENPPIDRVIAVPSEPHFICDIWHDLETDRPMPVYSIPGLGNL